MLLDNNKMPTENKRVCVIARTEENLMEHKLSQKSCEASSTEEKKQALSENWKLRSAVKNMCTVCCVNLQSCAVNGKFSFKNPSVSSGECV
jgi:hypothetical protein